MQPNEQKLIPATLIPGDGIGPEIRGGRGDPRCARRAFRLGNASGRHGRGRGIRRSAARGHARQHPPHAAGAEGPADDAGRRRLPLVERAPARGVQALRQPASGAHTDSRAAATTTSTSSWCARTSRACTSASSTTFRSTATRTRWRSRSGVNTAPGCRRIAEFAFDYAVTNGRKKVTIVHKANVMKALTGIFLETAREVAKAVRRPSCDRRPHRRRVRDAARAQPVAVRHDRHAPTCSATSCPT